MNKTILFASLFVMAGTVHGQVYTENFDAYTAGSLVVQTIGDPWTTWSGTPGSAEDMPISDEQAFSGTNSMLVTTTTPAGGPGDVVLKLGNTVTGVYGISWMMYIPSGFGGYFNIQHDEEPGVEWALDVIFRANGDLEFVADSVTTIGTYPQDEWFEVSIIVNHALDLGFFNINDEGEPLTWQFSTQVEGGPGMNQLGSINFFAYAGGTDPVRYYVDDILVEDLTNVGIEAIDADDINIYPNPVTDVLSLDLSGIQGALAVRMMDITGRVVMQLPLRNSYSGVVTIPMAHHASGIYFLAVTNGKDEFVERVVRN